MGRGRKRRLRNFQERAKDFARDVSAGGGHKIVVLDYEHLPVGIGKHKRLIIKKDSDFLRYLARLRAFENKVKSGELKLSHVALVPAHVSENVKVQEFFNKPSLMSLINFFKGKDTNRTLTSDWERKRTLILSRKMALLCKQFANQHKTITLGKLVEAREELDNFNIHAVNAIVLGKNRDGKIRISIIDFL